MDINDESTVKISNLYVIILRQQHLKVQASKSVRIETNQNPDLSKLKKIEAFFMVESLYSFTIYVR